MIMMMLDRRLRVELSNSSAIIGGRLRRRGWRRIVHTTEYPIEQLLVGRCRCRRRDRAVGRHGHRRVDGVIEALAVVVVRYSVLVIPPFVALQHDKHLLLVQY